MGDESTGGGPAPFASRAGAKLDHALTRLDLDVAGLRCADFGCNVGGFTDCLLRRGALKVYAIDTAYGVLDYRLRSDARVVVMERTNALHCAAPEPVDLVTIDLGWTRQRHAVPAALRWLASGGRIVTLIKPHYELSAQDKKELLSGGVLAEPDARRVLEEVLGSLARLGAVVLGVVESPLGGAKSARRSGGPGNREFLALLSAAAEAIPGARRRQPIK